jgi:hypothetical protein
VLVPAASIGIPAAPPLEVDPAAPPEAVPVEGPAPPALPELPVDPEAPPLPDPVVAAAPPAPLAPALVVERAEPSSPPQPNVTAIHTREKSSYLRIPATISDIELSQRGA